MKENIKTLAAEALGLYELKQHKLWFDEVCLWYLDQSLYVRHPRCVIYN